MNLNKLMTYFRRNKSAVSRVLGVTRLTLRTDINKGRDYIVVNSVVYKSIGKANTEHLHELDKLHLEDEFNRERGL